MRLSCRLTVLVSTTDSRVSLQTFPISPLRTQYFLRKTVSSNFFLITVVSSSPLSLSMSPPFLPLLCLPSFFFFFSGAALLTSLYGVGFAFCTNATTGMSPMACPNIPSSFWASYISFSFFQNCSGANLARWERRNDGSPPMSSLYSETGTAS